MTSFEQIVRALAAAALLTADAARLSLAADQRNLRAHGSHQSISSGFMMCHLRFRLACSRPAA